MIDLNNKVAIVTGGGRGQGAATARLFAEAGARVIICDVLDEEGQALAAEIGEAAIYRHLDVSRGDQWAAVVEEAEQGGAGVDILINNAAIGDSTPLLDVKPEMLQRLLNVNVTGTYIGMQAVLPGMIQRGRGAIVNISSVDGMRGNGGLVAYTSTKWAVRGMTKSAALEFANRGIRINSVHPGAVDTPMLNPSGGDTSALAASFRIPQGRVGTSTEIAYASLFLASDAASYINGAELAVDGAWSAGIVLGRISEHRK